MTCRRIGSFSRGCKCPTCQPFLYDAALNPDALPMPKPWQVHQPAVALTESSRQPRAKRQSRELRQARAVKQATRGSRHAS